MVDPADEGWPWKARSSSLSSSPFSREGMCQRTKLQLLGYRKDTLLSRRLPSDRTYRPNLKIGLVASLRPLQRLHKQPKTVMPQRQPVLPPQSPFLQKHDQVDPQYRTSVPAQLVAHRDVPVRVLRVGVFESEETEAWELVDEGERGKGGDVPVDRDCFGEAEVEEQVVECWRDHGDWRVGARRRVVKVNEAGKDGRNEADCEKERGFALPNM